MKTLNRSAIHGRIVSRQSAAASPDTTVTETVEPNALTIFIENLVNDGIDEMTLGDLQSALLRSNRRYKGKAQLKRAIERQLDLARD